MTASIGIAAIAGAEELRLDNGEANSLASAVKDLLEYYPVKWLDGRTAAWINLIQTSAIIIGPRMMAMRMRRDANKVIPLRPVPARPSPQPQTQQYAQAPQPSVMTPAGVNGAEQPPLPTREVPPEAKIGEIPGVGNVQFPDDHPLAGGKKTMN